MSWKFKKRVIDNIKCAKSKLFGYNFPAEIPIYNERGIEVGWLRPLTFSDATTYQARRLARWRKENSFAFPSQFRVTVPGTKRWLEKQVLENPERILFYIYSQNNTRIPIGHMGLASFDFRVNSCELDNIVRGEKTQHNGLMSMGVRALISWTIKYLQPKHILLRVMRENKHAIRFYEKLGFALLSEEDDKNINLIKMKYEQEE